MLYYLDVAKRQVTSDETLKLPKDFFSHNKAKKLKRDFSKEGGHIIWDQDFIIINSSIA